MTSLLEDRYRRALRWLPLSYRQQWEQDMVATFMERAYRARPDDPEGVELSSPRWPELADIAVLAVRLRLGGADAEPRYFAWGEAVRRVALVGLLAHTLFALTGVLMTVWLLKRLPGIPWPADDGFTGRWQALRSTAGLLWLPAYLSVVFHHRRAGRVLAGVAFLPVLASALVEYHAVHATLNAATIAWLLFDAMQITALAAFHVTAPAVRPRPWLLALPIGVVALFALEFLLVPLAGQPRYYQLASGPGVWSVGIAVAGIVSVVAFVRRPPRTPTWPLALALLATAVLILDGTVFIDDPASPPDHAVVQVIGVTQCLTMLVTAIVLALLAAHRPGADVERGGLVAPTGNPR